MKVEEKGERGAEGEAMFGRVVHTAEGGTAEG